MKMAYHYLTKVVTTIFISLLGITFTHAATLISIVDRNQISTNETLALTVKYDQQASTSQLDLSALKNDFEVLNVSSQSNNSIAVINGETTRDISTVWNIVLVPRREGKLTIPAFTLDNATSKALTIAVNNASQTATSNDPLQVNVTASHNTIYPAQQLIVEIELSAARDVSGLNGPQLIVKDADTEVLDQQNFQRVDNGVARQIVLLKYAVFPQQTGEMVIPVMTFTAVKGARSFRSRGTQVIARSKQLKINVKDAPAGNTAAWFPAAEVKVSAEWSRDIANLKVGEPITRTIKVTALEQRASMIPPLRHSTDSNEYKTYQDKPQLENLTNANGFISTRTESQAIVPSVAGKLTLPELRLTWWDVNKSQWREAVLPSETLQVTGEAITRSANTPDSLPNEQQTEQPAINSQSNWLWKLLVGLLAVVCIIQCWLIIKLRNQNNTVEPAIENSSEAKAWQQLQDKVKSKDPMQIRESLMAWAKIALADDALKSHPDYRTISLQSLANYFDEPEHQQALTNIDTHLFKGTNDFNSAEFTKTVNLLRTKLKAAKKNQASSRNDLEPLYAR